MHPEVALGLLRHGYGTLAELRKANSGADWFRARMLGRRALVVRGEEGVRTFYDPARVTRKGAIPAPLRLLLFGRGAVHGLAGEAHQQRKRMHLSLVDKAATDRLAGEVEHRLRRTLATWEERRSVQLFDELVDVYGASVLAWAGIDVEEAEARAVSRDLATIVDAFGLRGTGYVRGYAARRRANRWARSVVRGVREGSSGAGAAGAQTVVGRVAGDTSLSDTVAAVELLNILRPTVAVAYFGSFAALAIERRPDWRQRLADGAPEDLRAFGHELRRCYPFVPMLTGRLVRDYHWNGRRFGRGDFMVLDVIGTNQDPGLWPRPDFFDPDRFVGREPDAFEYVPHGGGDPAQGHRCPGEPLAVGILGVTVRELARTSYELAPRSRFVPVRRVPSLPSDGVRLRAVRRTTAPAIHHREA